jgi:hypothetical protein
MEVFGVMSYSSLKLDAKGTERHSSDIDVRSISVQNSSNQLPSFRTQRNGSWRRDNLIISPNSSCFGLLGENISTCWIPVNLIALNMLE